MYSFKLHKVSFKLHLIGQLKNASLREFKNYRSIQCQVTLGQQNFYSFPNIFVRCPAVFLENCIVTSVAFCQFARKLSLIQLGDLAVLEGSPSLQLLVSTCHCNLCPEVIKELFFTGSLCFFFCGRM